MAKLFYFTCSKHELVKKWDEDSERGKLLMAKSISKLEIKMSLENQLFCEIYKKKQLFSEFSHTKV